MSDDVLIRPPDEKYFIAGQWTLMARKFRKHKLAQVSLAVLALFYLTALFPDFFSVQDIYNQNMDLIFAPPQRIHFVDEDGFRLRPFVYGYKSERDPETLRKTFTEDTSQKFPLYFFDRGYEYRFLGMRTDLHLVGVREGYFYPFGTDKLGRDLYSRNIHAAQVSLTIGLVGVAISFVIGCLLGGLSGLIGGKVDMFIQRLIEFLMSIPTLPLWMGLSAAIPKKWPPVKTYFAITVILSIIGWVGLARVVRSKFLSIRDEDFVTAARISGGGSLYVIFKHMLPSFMSYLIVQMTLSVPRMILGETSLSFLGLGMQDPAVSWGVLLQHAQNFRTIAQNPWILIPGAFVVLVVLAFNFVGDGLRDAADPHK